MVQPAKTVRFLGDAVDRLRAFPAIARREAGYQLDKVQKGAEPNDWKPLKAVGKGAREIRVKDEHGAFRVLYVAKFAETVYVLHCFQKKSQATERRDIELAAQRYRHLLEEVHR